MISSDMKANRLADIQEVLNENPHWAAAKKYNHVRIEFPNGEEKSLLFTDAEIARALTRAEKNPEDLPTVSWLRNLFD